MKDFLKKYYNLDVLEINTLRSLENESFLAKTTVGKFAVRICKSKFAHKKLLEELSFLNHLNAHLFRVPRVEVGKDGEVSTFKNHPVIVFHWIEGEPLGSKVDSDDTLAMGKLMKKMHEVDPIELEHCPIYDHEWLYGDDSWFKREGHSHFNREVFNEINLILNETYMIMSQEPIRAIHSDIHSGNVIKKGKQYTFIDFDGYAMSSIYFDLGVTVLELMDFEDEDLIEAFLEGYGEVDSKKLDAYIVAACMVFIEWVLSTSNEQVKEEKSRYLENTIDILLTHGRRLLN